MSEGCLIDERRRGVKARWMRLLKEAVDADEWGQTVEATSAYRQFAELLSSSRQALELSTSEEDDVARVHESVAKRLAVLDGGASSLRVRDMKALVPIVEGLFSNAEGSGSSQGAATTSSAGLSKRHAQLQRQVQLEIVKIGLKDAPTYVKPHIAVTISQQNGRAVETTRQTAVAKGVDNLHLLFNEAMVLRTPLEDIPQDAAIFFEFKHFKEAKKKTSTRCYAFMETDEITEGGKVLELYRKPTDWTRKRVHLHSVKPLYLHVNVTFNPIAKPLS